MQGEREREKGFFFSGILLHLEDNIILAPHALDIYFVSKTCAIFPRKTVSVVLSRIFLSRILVNNKFLTIKYRQLFFPTSRQFRHFSV